MIDLYFRKVRQAAAPLSGLAQCNTAAPLDLLCAVFGGRPTALVNHWAVHPPHPLQAIVISEALCRAWYKFPGWKGGALQVRAVRT
jgi:hypothetical protein